MKQDIMLREIPSMVAAHKVAVVGNGGNILDAEEGELIDSYDVVIRMNTFDISDKFAKHTGKKTTLWSNAMHFRVPFREDKEYEQMICPIPLNINRVFKQYGATSKEMFAAYKDKAIYIPETYFLELTTKIPNPSTGIATLFWLKKENIQFDIFGFTFFSNRYSHHYHDDYKGCGHHGNKEQRFFEEYIAP